MSTPRRKSPKAKAGDKRAERLPALWLWLAVAAVLLIGSGVWWSLSRGPASSTQDAGLGQLGGDLHALAFAPEGRLFYGQHGGLQISGDAGQSWTPPSGTGDAMAISASPAQPEVIYQAGHDLFLKSTDGGQSWSSPGFGTLPGTDIHGFAVAPENGWLYANIAGRGLYRLTDDDGAWEFLSAATGGAMALAAGPGVPAVIYAATMEGVIRSEDGGGSWQRVSRAPGMSMSGIYVHPKSGNVYAAGQQGVYRSRDGGQSWTELGPGVPMALVAADPTQEDRLLAVSQQGKVYRSDDGGETWLK